MRSKVWSPTGVPTIYRIIEKFDSDALYNLDLVITSKDNNFSRIPGVVSKIKISGLSSVVTNLHSFNSKYGKVGFLLRESFHVLYLLAKLFFGRYDLLYVDHANIFTASIAARISKVPVVFRVMGVYPAMRNVITGSGIVNIFLRWCYRAPFSLVVCTQDGSGIEPWLDKALSNNVLVRKLINGVEYCKPTTNQKNILYVDYIIPQNKFLVLYLGKLEKIKGIYDFIEGFFLANKRTGGKLHAIIIGHGDQYANVVNLLENHPDKNSITLIPRVQHSKIFQFHEISDLYVSPNKLANLTNANLEAMQAGSCVAIPKSQSDTGVDLVTDTLLDDTAVYRYDFPPTPKKISFAITNLYSDTYLRESLSKNVVLQSNKFITSWNKRIELEMDLILSLVG
ncbi:glycosyltransferase [bacterium]|nr:glycosyltransferase [bacterium]